MCVSQEAEEQTKSLEDLEFQKLEREINQSEEKENQSQELLREIAECQRLIVTRKVQQERVCECACSTQGMFNTADGAGTASVLVFDITLSLLPWALLKHN